MKMNKAAFFDIDGTLFRNSLLIEHFHLLSKDNVINKKIWHDKVKPIYKKYQDRKGAYDDYLYTASLLYQESIKGLDKYIIDKYARMVIELNKSKVYQFTKKAIKFHKKRKDKVFVISGSPDFLVKEFAKIYGADHTIATKYLYDEEEKFTGKILPMWDSKNKKDSIDFLAEKYKVDLASSHAYGDTNGDFSMFEKVGNAHAINPSYELIDKLYKVKILRDKTKIHVERKDVNYTFALKDMKIEFKKF